MLPLLLLAVLQATVGQPAPAANPLLADCSGERNTQSCRSFNQLMESKDKHLLLSLSQDAYACFRPGDDVFFVVSFTQPPGNPDQAPVVTYQMFKGGVSDDFRTVEGSWAKAPEGSSVFHQNKSSEASASITGAEVQFGYSFKNAQGNDVGYSVQVRRSTLRFSEAYKWPNPED